MAPHELNLGQFQDLFEEIWRKNVKNRSDSPALTVTDLDFLIGPKLKNGGFRNEAEVSANSGQGWSGLLVRVFVFLATILFESALRDLRRNFPAHGF